MPKPKAPPWLREAFRDGVDEHWVAQPCRGEERLSGVAAECWLAQHDERQRPCSGPLERFHFITRQRVENALWALLPQWERCPVCEGDPSCEHCGGNPAFAFPRDDLILLAAWDPRNGGIACEGHHRRFDNHATPELRVPRETLPSHVVEFAEDWGLESELERRFA